LATQVDKVLTFPINRCDLVLPGQAFGQVDNNGNEVSCSTSPHKYDIIGFVDFRLTAVLDSAAKWGGVSVTGCDRNNFGPVNTNQVVSLFGLGGANCPNNTQTTATIDATTLRVNGKLQSDPGSRFTYDAVTKSITWLGPNGHISIAFNWWIDGQCGPPPTNSSAVCIKVDTVEVRVGGSSPGNGSPLSNLRPVKLCDQSVAGSCAPINVPNP